MRGAARVDSGYGREGSVDPPAVPDKVGSGEAERLRDLEVFVEVSVFVLALFSFRKMPKN